MVTTRKFTAQASTRVLDLTQQGGHIRILADATVQAPEVTIHTSSDTGPAADAVTAATISEHGGRLTINVKDSGGGGSNVVVTGNGSSIFSSSGDIHIGGAGRVIVNGVDVTDVVNQRCGGTNSTIETTIAVPPTTEVRLNTRSAESTITGSLKALDYGTHSGRLRADIVGDLDASLTSGSITVDRVAGRLNANLTSGSLHIGRYAGQDANLNMTSGSAHITVDRAASGRFSVGVTSGNAVISGASHLDVRRRVTSGSVHIS